MKKNICSIILVLIIIYNFTIPVNAITVHSFTNKEVKDMLVDFFTKEETLRNEVKYYGENVFAAVSKNEDNKDNIQYLIFMLRKIEKMQNDIATLADKYQDNDVEGRYISAVGVVLGYYKNSIYELLLYIKDEDYTKRFDALDRYFYNRLTARNTAEWLKEITKSYQ